MSLSKPQSLSDNRRKDSFDDRICDDLSEVIFQYLPIEDKFRFECLSKQFQRTVFQRHNEMVYEDYYRKKGFNSKGFEVMLKKLPQINCFRDFRGSALSRVTQLKDPEIELILKNCNNLVEIDMDLSLISETTQQLLNEKFGSKLVSINLNPKTIQMIGNWFPNIKEIRVIVDHTGWPTQLSQSVNNLNKISIECKFIAEDSGEQLDNFLTGFQEFVDNNESLTDLVIDFGYNAFDYIKTKQLDTFCEIVSQLNQLISFKLLPKLSIETMADVLQYLSLNCTQIKSLEVSTHGIGCVQHPEEAEADITQLMAVLKTFDRLKRLSIDFFYIRKKSISFLNNSFETGFKRLTHLSLIIDFRAIFLGKLFKDFSKYTPNLRYLKVRCNDIKGREKSVLSFNQFPRLETLELGFGDKFNVQKPKNKLKDKKLRDLIEAEVIKNCKNIKTIVMTIPEFRWNSVPTA